MSPRKKDGQPGEYRYIKLPPNQPPTGETCRCGSTRVYQVRRLVETINPVYGRRKVERFHSACLDCWREW